MVKKQLLGIAGVLSIALSGCGSMSGLGGGSSLSCKAPPGVTCQSMSGVYANAMQGNLPFQQDGKGERESKDEPVVVGKPAPQPTEVSGGRTLLEQEKVSPRQMEVAYSGMPIRQAPLVLRVWMAPYEDDAGDLHDQSYFYTMVSPGRWMIEANRDTIRKQYRPVLRPTSVQKEAQEAPKPRPSPSFQGASNMPPAGPGFPEQTQELGER